MVGKTKNLAELTSKYVGKSYTEYPCMVLIYSFYKDLDINIPNNFEDVNLDNYIDLWESDRENTFHKLLKFVNNIGKEICITKLKKYDFLIISDKNNNIYVGIYLYNNMFITSNVQVGVKISHLGKYNTIVKAIRLKEN